MKIAGIHPVRTALEEGKEIEKIYVDRNPGDSLAEIIRMAGDRSVPVRFVPAKKLNALYKGAHQGVVAVISPIHFVPVEKLVAEAFEKQKHPYFLLLDGITDTRNLGAVMRSAVAFEVAGIILPEHHSAGITEDTVKTSAGGIFHVPVSRVKHLLDAVLLLKSYDVEIIAASEKARESLETYAFKKSVAFIMGNENKGVSKKLLENADNTLKINISPVMDSLNVSVATSIFCYEYHRQKLFFLEK